MTLTPFHEISIQSIKSSFQFSLRSVTVIINSIIVTSSGESCRLSFVQSLFQIFTSFDDRLKSITSSIQFLNSTSKIVVNLQLGSNISTQGLSFFKNGLKSLTCIVGKNSIRIRKIVFLGH